MSAEHHGIRGNPEVIRRFLDQCNGEVKREWPAGRMGGEDDGALSYAITTDQKNRTIVIRFGKPVEWIGLDVESAEQLRDELTKRLALLKVGSA